MSKIVKATTPFKLSKTILNGLDLTLPVFAISSAKGTIIIGNKESESVFNISVANFNEAFPESKLSTGAEFTIVEDEIVSFTNPVTARAGSSSSQGCSNGKREQYV